MVPESPADNATDRRPVKTRGRSWAIALASALARRGVTPNSISVASIFMAALACAGLILVRRVDGGLVLVCYGVGVAGIQLRLLCNLIDGMVAVEHQQVSPTGGLYNEFPDRISDSLILIGAGCGLMQQPVGAILGMSAALIAMLTAYVRALGVTAGAASCFLGPMAKQHRMALITVACLAGAVEHGMAGSQWSMTVALWMVIAGSALTVHRRLRRIGHDLHSR